MPSLSGRIKKNDGLYKQKPSCLYTILPASKQSNMSCVCRNKDNDGQLNRYDAMSPRACHGMPWLWCSSTLTSFSWQKTIDEVDLVSWSCSGCPNLYLTICMHVVHMLCALFDATAYLPVTCRTSIMLVCRSLHHVSHSLSQRWCSFEANKLVCVNMFEVAWYPTAPEFS